MQSAAKDQRSPNLPRAFASLFQALQQQRSPAYRRIAALAIRCLPRLAKDDEVLPRQRLDRLHEFQLLHGHFLAHLLDGHLVQQLDRHLRIFPAKLHMALHTEDYPELPPAVLWVRLPLQALFIAWAYWFTRLKSPTGPIDPESW